MTPNQYLIPEPLLRGLMDYLATRPWAEVHQAMAALASLPKAESAPPPKP